MKDALPRVLIVDDQAAMAEAVADGLRDFGFSATATSDGKDAARLLEDGSFDALVTDLRMPDVDGLTLLALSRKLAPERPVIVMTAFSAIDSAIASIRAGAYHYLTKPFKMEELALFLTRALDDSRVRREAHDLKIALADGYSFGAIVGKSTALGEVCSMLARVANANVPILLTGETGTGKSLLARAVHEHSERKARRFVTVNCAALPETLLESELFGHARGAFTGAVSARDGLFVSADGGTLFLDEIGETSLALQAKLLDVVERGVVRTVGSNTERPVNVRIIAATHRDLRARVRDGGFREDLLYRLEVLSVVVPSLRHRREDIPFLVTQFLERARLENPNALGKRFSAEAMQRILQADWPGNVRELKHAVERGVLLARGDVIAVTDLLPTLTEETPQHGFGTSVVTMREMQRRYAEWALARMGGKKLQTSEALDIDPKTLSRLLETPS